MKNDVVVVMSTYNPVFEFFIQQIESILNQNVVRTDIIIRDDGSCTETVKKIEKYCNSISNIHLIKGENFGFKKSFYIVLQEARKRQYNYYAYADQDDIWEPNKLSILLDNIPKSNSAELIFSNGFVIAQNKIVGNIYTEEHVFAGFLDFLYRPTYGMTFLFNQQLVNVLIKGGVEPFEIYAHDGWSILVASVIGHTTFVPDNLVKYRQHAQNASGVKKDKYRIYRVPLYMFGFHKRVRKWRYKISSVSKDLMRFVGPRYIQDPLIRNLCEDANSLPLKSKLELISNNKLTTHSYLQDLAIKILLLEGKI